MGEPLDRAMALAAARGWPGPLTAGAALRATLPGSDPSRALALLVEHGETLSWVERLDVHVALAKATSDPWHARQAVRALEGAQAELLPAVREAMDKRFPAARAVRLAAEAVDGGPR